MLQPNRTYSVGDYRYGFNGKEMDNEVKGTGAQYDYGFRIYDPRIVKFLSVDPLFKTYPWYTPYQFAGNKPIIAVDLDGLEEKETNYIEIFVFKMDAGLEGAARSASANPKAIALLQQQSWNKIIVDINNIVQGQFNPNCNIDPEFGNRVKEATLSYLRSDPSNLLAYNTYSYYNNVAGGNTDLTSIDQSILDKSLEIANDHARSAFFGQASYNNDLNKINQAKDPNSQAALIQERHDRTTKNYQFVGFVNLWIMEMFGGFMGLAGINLGPLSNTTGFSLNNAARYNSVDDLLIDAGKLTRLKGGVRQGSIKGDAYEVLEGLSKKYGAELKTTGDEIFFESGGTRVGIHNSTRDVDHTQTLHIKNGAKNYKIRVSND